MHQTYNLTVVAASPKRCLSIPAIFGLNRERMKCQSLYDKAYVLLSSQGRAQLTTNKSLRRNENCSSKAMFGTRSTNSAGRNDGAFAAIEPGLIKSYTKTLVEKGHKWHLGAVTRPPVFSIHSIKQPLVARIRSHLQRLRRLSKNLVFSCDTTAATWAVI